MTETITSAGEAIDTDDADLRASTAHELGDHVLQTLDLPGLPQYVAGHAVLALEQLAAAGRPGAMRALGQLVDRVQPYAQLWDAGLWTHPDLITPRPPAPPTPAAAGPMPDPRYRNHGFRLVLIAAAGVRVWQRWRDSASLPRFAAIWVLAGAVLAYGWWTR